MESVDTYVQDVIHHVELMKKEYPSLPCILLGHSMASVCLQNDHVGDGHATVPQYMPRDV